MGKVSGFLFVLPYVLILSTYESRDRFLQPFKHFPARQETRRKALTAAAHGLQ